MKKIFTIIAILAVAATACNKADFISNNGNPATTGRMVTETISATNGENRTKAEIAADASFTWSVGDHIAVHVSNGENHKYVFTSDPGASGASAAAAKTSFTVVYEEGYARDAFAVYPATIVNANAANYGQEGHTLDVTLPANYTLAQVSDTATPCPMIATNATDSDWTFYQLCGLLRLTVSGIPTNSKRLEINFDGKNVTGDFAIPVPVMGDKSSTIALSDASGNNSATITITKDGTDATLNKSELVLNIPLPVGTYTNITVTAYDELTGGNITIATPFAFTYSATRAHGSKTTIIFPGLFSVSSDKKVIFAPGNLQYLGNSDGSGTWRFADHQYDFMGDGPSSGTDYQGNVTVPGFTKYNASADKAVARDLFGWGTSGYENKYPYMTSESSGDYYSGSLNGTDYDWGIYHSASGHSSEKITNGGTYTWRLFTADEWAYIIARQGKVYTREDYQETKDLFASATVMGVKGIILFPDNWDGSSDRTIKYGNDTYADYTVTVRNAEQWALLERMGCVFLPAAHVRDGASMTFLNQGHYWAGTVFSVLNNTERRGGELEFSNTGAVTKSSTNNCLRDLGQSVRLIRDVEYDNKQSYDSISW